MTDDFVCVKLKSALSQKLVDCRRDFILQKQKQVCFRVSVASYKLLTDSVNYNNIADLRLNFALAIVTRNSIVVSLLRVTTNLQYVWPAMQFSLKSLTNV